ncbi:Luciferin 4-monooxygenase-like [Homarus americanus]|uniref:Luciferin 4-monooxygenase-like n=1 Tax=Homarus americanus TaxID=6706 RepID=A0A8J5N1Q6_HOMAM|nr:Luciferin 4-monooxygenase-like [Homarus americanus]
MGPRVLEWEGPGPLPPIPDTNFAAYMLEMMEEHGDSVAVVVLVIQVDAETHHQRTFSELCSLVPRVSAGLAAAGVTPGEVVAVITPNHVDYPLVLLSILHRGAVCFGINSLLTPKEVNHVLKISGACWAVVHESMVAEAEAAFSLLPSSTIRKMWVLGDVSGKPSVADLMSHDPLPPFTKVDGLNPARDVAIIYSSSGTTGMPKPVKLSHRNQLTVMALNKCMDSLHQTGINRREMYEVTFMVLPMSHIYGQTNTILTLLFGGTVVVLPKFSATQFLEALQNFRVTLIPLVPFLIKFLVETPLLHRYDLSSLKYMNTPCHPQHVTLTMSPPQHVTLNMSPCHPHVTPSCHPHHVTPSCHPHHVTPSCHPSSCHPSTCHPHHVTPNMSPQHVTPIMSPSPCHPSSCHPHHVTLTMSPSTCHPSPCHPHHVTLIMSPSPCHPQYVTPSCHPHHVTPSCHPHHVTPHHVTLIMSPLTTSPHHVTLNMSSPIMSPPHHVTLTMSPHHVTPCHPHKHVTHHVTLTLMSPSSCHPQHVTLTMSPHHVTLIMSPIMSPSSCHPHHVTLIMSPSPCHPHHVTLTMSPSSCHPHHLSVQLNDQYGMTEASYAVAENIVRVGFKDNTVGKVLPYFQIKVVETESGEMLGEGQEGEVCFRGPSTMLGYANNPVATAATLDADGWIHSGDIGYFDHDNYLFIMDRLKNLIKVKGFQVSPTELESVIMEHPDVANAAVVGVPHDSLGEMPLAFVVVKPGAHIQAIVLQQFVDSRVASFKKLAGGVKFVDAIPMNPTGKINRKLLKESVSLVAKL